MAQFKHVSIWQGDHKSTLAYYEEQPASAWAMGNIPHGAPLTFDKKDVPKIIELLQMENSPLVRENPIGTIFCVDFDCELHAGFINRQGATCPNCGGETATEEEILSDPPQPL